MWKYIVEPERPQLTIWPMRISRWVPKATNTQSQHAILIAFALQQWLNERTSMLRYTTLPVLFCLTGIKCRANCHFFISSVLTNKFGVRLNIFDRNPQTPLPSVNDVCVCVCEYAINLSAVLYGCDTWSLKRREEHRLKVFDNRVLRMILGLRRTRQ